jgi:hypothetical protein
VPAAGNPALPLWDSDSRLWFILQPAAVQRSTEAHSLIMQLLEAAGQTECFTTS